MDPLSSAPVKEAKWGSDTQPIYVHVIFPAQMQHFEFFSVETHFVCVSPNLI